ncbi:MAG: ABC transporter ATP-binding protein [Candidatus Eremiobacteraeota bacterium]|nr:ABC transporter ATP-binding protein [Candidatus Eremiobacteraeota bacterium]MBC5802490.1 ABC transporter ATP-binding protein [Candidatus Eremiobacteraeota bacterium]MBC5821592.1 ABC transporter ATP-binding protein [Candidatus Eremiobacteraeota bacterium]
MAHVRLERIGKTFIDVKPAIEAVCDLSLWLNDGERLAIVGPSGCGKTTLLRLIAGLERLDCGSVRFEGRDLAGVPPEKRSVAMVFANDALFANRTVFDNIAYPLRLRGRRAIEQRVVSEASTVRVADLLGRYPRQLSSGQRQRVALARALATDPAVLLMDEPFSRLDAPLRVELRIECARVLAERAVTTIFVTHDQSEALALAQRVALMRDGSLEQIGTLRELYERPANEFVARFIGSPAMVIVPAQALGFPEYGSRVRIGLRSDAVRLVSDGEFCGTVRAVEDLGADGYAYVDGAFGSLTAHLRPGEDVPGIGERVTLAIDRGRTYAFAADGTNAGV